MARSPGPRTPLGHKQHLVAQYAHIRTSGVVNPETGQVEDIEATQWAWDVRHCSNTKRGPVQRPLPIGADSIHGNQYPWLPIRTPRSAPTYTRWICYAASAHSEPLRRGLLPGGWAQTPGGGQRAARRVMNISAHSPDDLRFTRLTLCVPLFHQDTLLTFLRCLLLLFSNRWT